VEDENLVEFERCSDCEGEGIIITNYYPATRYDPADADFEKCEMCFGSGKTDPSDYMDYDGNYMAESLDEWDERMKEKYYCDDCDSWEGCECPEDFIAESNKRKAGIRKCSKCGDYNHNAPNCNRLNEYEEYLKHKDEMPQA